MLSDIFPTAYFGAELAEVHDGDIVAVFGCRPVGQFAIASAKLFGAGRVIAVDCLDDRLALAKRQGAEIVNYEQEDPIKAILNLTNGIVDRAIDAVGVDANHPHHGAVEPDDKEKQQFEEEKVAVAPRRNPQNSNRRPGEAPSQVLKWATEALAKAGTLSIIGVYPEGTEVFPIGQAMNKNLRIKMGNCNHRKYIPTLLRLVQAGTIDPTEILTKHASLEGAIEAYKNFDRRRKGWTKVELVP